MLCTNGVRISDESRSLRRGSLERSMSFWGPRFTRKRLGRNSSRSEPSQVVCMSFSFYGDKKPSPVSDMESPLGEWNPSHSDCMASIVRLYCFFASVWFHTTLRINSILQRLRSLYGFYYKFNIIQSYLVVMNITVRMSRDFLLKCWNLCGIIKLD